MMWLLALMAVREPLRLSRAGELGLRLNAAWFPGGDGNWPALGVCRVPTVHALIARGAIEPATGSDLANAVVDLLPSAAGLAAVDLVEVRLAARWNDLRNERKAACMAAMPKVTRSESPSAA